MDLRVKKTERAIRRAFYELMLEKPIPKITVKELAERAEIKSGTYQLAMWATYFFCYLLIRLEMSTLMFGIVCIALCVAYSAAACALVYHVAPRTFRIRN